MNHQYELWEGIEPPSSEADKIDIFIKKIKSLNHGFCPLIYPALLIPDHEQNYFLAKIKESNFFEEVWNENSNYPSFKLSDFAAIKLKEYKTYKRWFYMDKTFEETCEIVFQMHKNDDYKHWWSSESYSNKPVKLSAAKEFLIHKGVLTTGGNAPNFFTALIPDFYFVNSYEDAVKIIEANNSVQKEIQRLTLEAMEYDKERRKWKEEKEKLEHDLAEAQKKDIPIAAEDRKTSIHWQIATGVLLIVAFLLKLFGVKGWLE